MKSELRQRMHQPLHEQGKWLGQVVRGYFAYHAVPTNAERLSAFRHDVVALWRRALRRRSQKDGTTWSRIERLSTEFIPMPRILHPWPDQRFLVKHPRWEPSARIGPARFYAGALRNERPYRDPWSKAVLQLVAYAEFPLAARGLSRAAPLPRLMRRSATSGDSFGSARATR